MIDTYIKRSEAIRALDDMATKERQKGHFQEGIIYNMAALMIEKLEEYQGELPEKGDNDVQKYKVIIKDDAVNTMLMAGTNKRSKGHVWDALTYDTAAKRLREMKTYEVVLPEDNEDDEDFWDEEEFEDEAD